MWLGGDLPWLKRLLGISPCPQVASLYHEGVKDRDDLVYVGSEVRRSDASDAANRAAYQATGKSLVNAGCINTPLVTHPERMNFVACILHCSMALGRLLCEFINLLLATRHVDKVALQRVLTEAKTGFTLGSTAAPDGEDTHRLFGAWDLVAEHLGLDPCDDCHKAVVGIREMLKAMYVTFQPYRLEPDYCATRIKAFQTHCMKPGKGGHYISLLLCDFDRLMCHIYPFGLALFCNDVIESLNRFLKLAYTEHSNRGGGHRRTMGPTTHPVYQTTIFTPKVPIWCNALNGFSYILIYFWWSMGTPARARHRPPRPLSRPLRPPPPHALHPSPQILRINIMAPKNLPTEIPPTASQSGYLPPSPLYLPWFSLRCRSEERGGGKEWRG